MATSMAALSRRLSRALISSPKPSLHQHRLSQSSFAFSTVSDDDSKSGSELEDAEAFLSDTEAPAPQSSSSPNPSQARVFNDPVLENGLDMGIYKAILVGQVGHKPVQKKLRSGMTLTLLSVATGGVRNNRRPLDNESPQEFAGRSSVQWHRICIYPERLGNLVLRNAVPGSILYIDGNLETKIFNDPITGVVRRVREISVRRTGRIIFLGKSDTTEEPTLGEVRGLAF